LLRRGVFLLGRQADSAAAGRGSGVRCGDAADEGLDRDWCRGGGEGLELAELGLEGGGERGVVREVGGVLTHKCGVLYLPMRRRISSIPSAERLLTFSPAVLYRLRNAVLTGRGASAGGASHPSARVAGRSRVGLGDTRLQSGRKAARRRQRRRRTGGRHPEASGVVRGQGGGGTAPALPRGGTSQCTMPLLELWRMSAGRMKQSVERLGTLKAASSMVQGLLHHDATVHGVQIIRRWEVKGRGLQ
jgi:hypothetical protein